MMKRLLAILLTLMMLTAAALAETPVSDDLRDMLAAGTFRPADVGFPAQESYDFPYMGLTMQLPAILLEQIEAKETYMSLAEGERSEAGELTYSQVTWSAMTEEQRNAEISMMDGDLGAWLQELGLMGMVGFYHTDVLDTLDQLSDCTRHEKLGESPDGKYHYYLSLADGLTEKTESMLRDISLTYTDIEPYPDFCGTGGLVEEELDAMALPENSTAANLGSFATQDVNGKAVDQSIFAENKLTLVNIMATWCSPCVAEMPELAKLSQNMAEKGVGVTAFVLDARNMFGDLDQSAINMAKKLAERAGVEFPMLVPDETLLNGWLANVSVVPSTFFVDSNGNLVGDMVMGANKLDAWTTIVEERLAMLPEVVN